MLLSLLVCALRRPRVAFPGAGRNAHRPSTCRTAASEWAVEAAVAAPAWLISATACYRVPMLVIPPGADLGGAAVVLAALGRRVRTLDLRVACSFPRLFRADGYAGFPDHCPVSLSAPAGACSSSWKPMTGSGWSRDSANWTTQEHSMPCASGNVSVTSIDASPWSALQARVAPPVWPRRGTMGTGTRGAVRRVRVPRRCFLLPERKGAVPRMGD